jgi:hypothetical protein
MLRKLNSWRCEKSWVVYYESMKRKVKIKPIYECRCNGRLQTTVTLIIFDESVMCRRRHYLFGVTDTGGELFGVVVTDFFLSVYFWKDKDEGLTRKSNGRTAWMVQHGNIDDFVPSWERPEHVELAPLAEEVLEVTHSEKIWYERYQYVSI